MFDSRNAVLIVVDIQGRLADIMFERERVFKNTICLIKVATILEIPIIWTEQVPEKIGATTPEIAQALEGLTPITKAAFSCYREKKFVSNLEGLKRRQIIVCGIEAHVCVHQTVADLLDNEYKVQFVTDAISSRTEDNYRLALRRMRDIGALESSTEMIVTELLETGDHPDFKEILGFIK